MVQSIDPAMMSLTKQWWTLNTTFLLLLATARRRSYLRALCVSTCLFTCGDVQNQLVVNLLPRTVLLAKNQIPDQVLQWIRIPGIAHLNSDELERILCWKSDVNTSPSAQVWLHMWPVDSVPFHLRQIWGPRLLLSCVPTKEIPGSNQVMSGSDVCVM